MSAALLTKRQVILPGSLQLSPKRRCKIRHFCLQISGICTCKKHPSPRYKNIRLILEAGQDLPKKDSPKEEIEDTVNKYTHLRGPEYYGGDFNE